MKRGPKKEFDARLEIRIERELLERLREVAEERGLTISELVRETIERRAA